MLMTPRVHRELTDLIGYSCLVDLRRRVRFGCLHHSAWELHNYGLQNSFNLACPCQPEFSGRLTILF